MFTAMGTRKAPAILCQELIDIIVDYNHSDHATLISCSLTSHLFLPSSRFHLFSRLCLRPSQWTPFFDLLESSLSTITHVQFIKIDFERGGPELLSILTRLQGLRLHSLLLANMQIRQHTDFEWELTGFVGLKKLIIKRSVFSTPSNMFHIISKFSSVEHLFICQTDYTGDIATSDHHAVTRNSIPLSWRTFELHCWSDCAGVLTWLTVQPDILALRTVVLTGLMVANWKPVGNLLRALGARLEYLELQLAFDSTIEHSMSTRRDISVYHNICLHFLTILYQMTSRSVSIYLSTIVCNASTSSYQISSACCAAFKQLVAMLSPALRSFSLKLGHHLCAK